MNIKESIMKKNVCFLALLLFALVGRAQDPNFYIYLAIGQSNMVGQGPIAAEDSVVSERFLNLTASDCDTHPYGQWRKAVPPLCRQWTKLCPVDYFGRTMLDHLPENTRVGTIMVAVNGCSIRLFHPDSCSKWIAGDLPDWQRAEVNCYGGLPLHRLLTLAKKAQRDGVIKGILVHQGETDAYDERWLKMVKELYEYLLEELNLNAADCPIIVGETVGEEYHGVCAHALPTIRRLPEWVPTAHVVSAEGCPPLDDNVHFSSEGYRTLGRRYAFEALKALGVDYNDDTRGKTEVETAKDAFSVDVLIKNNRAVVKASTPIKSVEVVSYSGQKVGFVERVGAPSKKMKIDLSALSDKVFIFIVEDYLGNKVTGRAERGS